MQKTRRGLGSAVKNLKISKPMRSRLADALVPPPVPEQGTPQETVLERRFDPKVVAERVWMKLMGEGSESDFEVRFTLKDNREFALRGDKEGFASVQPLEPFDVSQDLLLKSNYKDIDKIELICDEMNVSFTLYDDFIEWLELE